MKNRVKEILSPEVLNLMGQKETEGYSRHGLVQALLARPDKLPEEVIKEYCSEAPGTAEEPVYANASRDLLVRAIMTDMELKENIAGVQNLLNKIHNESEE